MEDKEIGGIREDLVRLQENQQSTNRAITHLTQSIEKLVDKLDASDDVAKEASQRAKSNQHRIDSIEKNLKWLIGTTLTVAGLFIAALGLLWKIGGIGS